MIETIVKEIENMEGNHVRRDSWVLISPSNMEKLPGCIDDLKDAKRIYISPFLINLEKNSIYELLWYCFIIEISEASRSYFEEYDKNNCLAKEIVDNLKPKAVVARTDKKFAAEALQNYLKNMKKMAFEEERNFHEDLGDAELFYEIIIV